MWKTKPQKWQNLIIINVPLQIKSCNSRRTHGTPLAFHFYGQIIANNLQFTRPHKIRFSSQILWLLHFSSFLNQLSVNSMESWLFECYKIFVKCRIMHIFGFSFRQIEGGSLSKHTRTKENIVCNFNQIKLEFSASTV